MHRGRGRGRGRGQGLPSERSDLINVGMIVRYANGDTNQGHMRWPSSITEEQAIHLLLTKLPDSDLVDLMQVSFSQTPRVGVDRIRWMDEAPFGHYYFNQHLYGENGVHTQLNAELREQQIYYNPDMPNIQYKDSIVDYLQRPQDSREGADKVGPRRYDPDVY